MDIRQQIYREAQRLPEFLAKEVLDFIEYISLKHRLHVHKEDALKEAQGKVMNDVWDNPEDEVWNDV